MGRKAENAVAATKIAFDEALALLSDNIGVLLDVDVRASDVETAEFMYTRSCANCIEARNAIADDVSAAPEISATVAACADLWCVLMIDRALYAAAVRQREAWTKLGSVKLTSREDHEAALNLCYEAAGKYSEAVRLSF